MEPEGSLPHSQVPATVTYVQKRYVCIKTLRMHKDVLTNRPVTTTISLTTQRQPSLHCSEFSMAYRSFHVASVQTESAPCQLSHQHTAGELQ